jgi:predicted AAA+ superfamily ATPase
MSYIPRELEHKLGRFIQRREIVGIQGPRQSGKTTLLRRIFEDLEPPKAFVNLDIFEERTALSRNPTTFLRRHLPEERGFLFLDEVQNVENAGESLKILYDEFPGVKIFVSGSSSLKLRSDVAVKLVGRFLPFDLLSFSFYEFLLSKDRGIAELHKQLREETLSFIKGDNPPRESVYIEQFRALLSEYLTYGGYPAVVLERDEEVKQKLLKSLLSLYLDKDVVGYFSIEHVDKFLNTMKYLAATSGSVLSLSSLSSSVGISYKTAEKFLSVLELSYIIERVKPFYRNLVTELKKSPKVYFYDVGLRNAVLGDFTPAFSRSDSGVLLENFVFGELRRLGLEVRYWRTTAKAEVDFVIPSDPPVSIEVKASGKPTRGFYSFIKHYNVERAIVFTDRYGTTEIAGATVVFLPWWYI